MGICEPYAHDDRSAFLTVCENMRRDVAERDLRPPKHAERARALVAQPRQVDEASSGSALNVRACDVDAVRGDPWTALDDPHRAGRLARHLLEHLVRSVAALHGDSDVRVLVRRIGAQTALTSRELACLDTDVHATMVSR